ncbi:MAG: hypothetical protein DA407_08965 [Bacteroidetes bacterium]|nr:MAG: hypothetical protein DA407_08965 [Bacteroidota bacterium]
MKFSINKVLATFANKKTKERTLKDNYTENIVNSIEDKAFAVSERNVMYASTKELGGYYYLKTIIVGEFKIKTMKGAKLTLKNSEIELELNADMDEFESDHSNVSNTFMTRIDFQIEESDVQSITNDNLETLTLRAKKHLIVFTPAR